MAWIESHQELRNHPKVKRLARKLNISVATAIGHLQLFWWWTMDYAENGDLSKYDPEDIADAANWDGDSNAFLDAMVTCGPGDSFGFIDRHGETLFVHDWHQYIGKLLERKAKDRERKSQKCNADVQNISNGTPTEIVKIPCVHNPTITTIHNHTQPDPTSQPDQPGDGEVAERVTIGKVISLWNDKLVPLGFPEVQKASPSREKAFRARLNEDQRRHMLTWWGEQFEYMAHNEFLLTSAKDGTGWLTFDWVMNENNLVKITERKYKNGVWKSKSSALPHTQKNMPLEEYMAGFTGDDPLQINDALGGAEI